MRLNLPCGIRACPHYVEVELQDIDGRPISSDYGFALCNECHTRIFVGTAIVIQNAGAWAAHDNHLKLAAAFAGLIRRRKGVTWLFGPNPVGQAPGLPNDPRGN